MNKAHAFFELMRLDKPIGIYLLLWPALLALIISTGGNFIYSDFLIVEESDYAFQLKLKVVIS